jgi:tRNA-Thr(GGU) m(6)t(6)A37 methyltransferase TsaA
MEFSMRSIGVIHTPFLQAEDTPIQSSRSQAVGLAEVDPEYAAGLQDIDGFSHLILLYAFHRSSGCALRVTPFLDQVERGLFATRHPNRPNPIGLSIVRLLARKDNNLTIEGVDMLDGTPLLDIKPYVTDFDLRSETRNGWYETRSVK